MISAGFIEPNAGCVLYAPGAPTAPGMGVENEVLGGALTPPLVVENELFGGTSALPLDAFSAGPPEGLLALEQGAGTGPTGGAGNIGTPEGKGGGNGPGSTQLLGAHEALQRLCEVEPDRPVLYGAGRLTLGGAIFAALPLAQYGMHGLHADIGCAIAQQDLYLTGFHVLFCLACLYAVAKIAPRQIVDGFFSVTKPLRYLLPSEWVRHHNGGFTNRLTATDFDDGTLVNPIDSADDLRNVGKKELAFMNGVTVTHAERTVEGGGYIEDSNVTYTVHIRGELHGEPVAAHLITNNFHEANRLLAAKNGPPVRIVVKVDTEDGKIEIQSFGDAFTRTDAETRPEQDRGRTAGIVESN